MALLFEYAAAAEAGRWADRPAVHREYRTSDPEDWAAAETWIEEENLADIEDVDEDGFVRATVTPEGMGLLRWWGWEELERADVPTTRDFVTRRNPTTHAYELLRNGHPRGATGFATPKAAAAAARRINPRARVFLSGYPRDDERSGGPERNKNSLKRRLMMG